VLHRASAANGADPHAGHVAHRAANKRQAITQEIEARVRKHWSDLGARRRFDASFVLNHTADMRPLLTGCPQACWRGSQRNPGTIESINQLLSDVAHSVADYSKGLTKGDNLPLFIKLARLGADLYSVLVMITCSGRSRRDGRRGSNHIQIISTRADAVVPFEFIYQYEPPDDDSGVSFVQCAAALKAARARGLRRPEGAAPHVCPWASGACAK